MSYFLRIWTDQTSSGTYTDISHADIIDISLDDNKSSNDDPFEVVGRQAKLVLRKYASTDFLLSLTKYDIPIGEVYNPTTSGNPPVIYNKNFYKHLAQIINDADGSPIFTGLIGRESVTYNLLTQQIEITIYDTLYIWIILSATRTFNNPNDAITKYQLYDYIRSPLFLPSSYDQTNALGTPLNQFALDVNNIPEVIVNGVELSIPEGELRAYQYDVFNSELGLEESFNEWGVLGQYSAVFPRDDLFSISVCFFTLFRSVGTVNSQYNYRVKAQKALYTRDSFIQPDYFSVLEFGNTGTAITTLTGLNNTLVNARIIPNDINYPTTESCVMAYGLNNQHQITTTRPVWELQTYYVIGSQEINLNVPTFGFANANVNIYPTQIKGDFTSGLKTSQMNKAFLTLWGFGLRSNSGGGLTAYPHLIRSLGTGTPLAIADADVILFSSKGTYGDYVKYAESLEVFQYGYMVRDTILSYYRDFYDSVTATFTITVPRSYFDNNILLPFMPITVYGKTIYLNKWSEPLYDDTITIECFGEL